MYAPYLQQPSSGQQFYAQQYGFAGDQGAARAMGTMGAGVDGAYGDMQGTARLSTGILAALGTSGYPGEPPLLEELGVNLGHIWQKTKIVLNPFRTIDSGIMDDSDLAGPLLFFLLLGVFLFLNGKVHFGYIYGLGLLGTLGMNAILNLMSLHSVDFMRTMSVLGYCILPLVATSALGVFLSLDNYVGYCIGIFAIMWATYSSSAMFVSYLQLSEMRVLVAYPLVLFYGIFSLMTLFSDVASKRS